MRLWCQGAGEPPPLEAVTRATGQELFDAMTPAEQDAAYGPEKAQLLRDGEVNLSDLVDHFPLATEEDFITAKPLDAVRPTERSSRDG